MFTEEIYNYIKRRNDIFANDPNLQLPKDVHELTRNEFQEAWWKIYYHLMKYDGGQWFRDNLETFDKDQLTIHALAPNGGPLLLHISMFMNSIKNLGNEEQKKKFLPLA